MKKKPNNYNYLELNKMKEVIEKAFPQKMNVGFYIKDFKTSSFANNQKLQVTVASGSVQIRNDSANLRIYRKADKGEHLFDVDEIDAVNKNIKIIKSPEDIKNHHLNKSIPEDIMSTNNLTLEVIENEDGTLSFSRDENGMIKALVNFPDPRELR